MWTRPLSLLNPGSALCGLSQPIFALSHHFVIADRLQDKVVRAAGLEPALLAEPDFESGASTNSTTPAMSCLNVWRE
jgi:hypothetical protein